jgi:hypothetical protein
MGPGIIANFWRQIKMVGPPSDVMSGGGFLVSIGGEVKWVCYSRF